MAIAVWVALCVTSCSYSCRAFFAFRRHDPREPVYALCAYVGWALLNLLSGSPTMSGVLAVLAATEIPAVFRYYVRRVVELFDALERATPH